MEQNKIFHDIFTFENFHFIMLNKHKITEYIIEVEVFFLSYTVPSPYICLQIREFPSDLYIFGWNETNEESVCVRATKYGIYSTLNIEQ